jgi:hypothetical protein
MINNPLFRICLGLLILCSVAFAERGDKFIDLQATVEPVSDFNTLPAGGQASFQFGVNENTDMGISAGALVIDDSVAGNITKMNFRLSSYFTPYFGELRPKFGGSIGLAKFSNQTKPDFDLAAHVMGLYDMSGSLRMYVEVSPGLIMGKSSSFYTDIGLGVQFRLGK